jgi:hypothetical protein
MSKIDDLEFDLGILSDVVSQIEQDLKGLARELVRVKELLEDARKAAQEIRVVPKGTRH